MKRFLALFLTLALFVGLLPATVAFAQDVLITNPADVSGGDFTDSPTLATRLDEVFSGDIDIFTYSGTEVSMPVGTNMNNSVKYWVWSNASGNPTSGWQCYIYANAVYNKLFNEWVGHGNSFAHSEAVISGAGINSLSYSTLSSAGVHCGAYVRTTNNSSGAYNGNAGHSLVILSYDESGITYIEGNGDGNGAVRINTNTWEYFNSSELSGRSRYISHIVQPTESYMQSLYPGYSGNYLSQCESMPSYCTIKITADTSVMTLPRNAQEADSTSKLIESASEGDVYTAIGLYKNTFGNLWYKVKAKNGEMGYIYARWTSLQSTLNDVTISDVSAPTELEVSKGFPIKGNISATYSSISTVGAYVLSGTTLKTGEQRMAVGEAKSYNLASSAVDSAVKFGTLSAGIYTYQILVGAKSYYATSGQEYTAKTTEKVLYESTFTVVEPAESSNSYIINGKTVSISDYPTSQESDCWNYANDIYEDIWGVKFTNSFSESSNMLRNLSDSEITLTEAHLKEYVSNAEIGSCLRICDSEYLHGTDGWGHSQLIVQKDSNGFTVLEGGLTNYPHCREQYYTWNEYINTSWLGKYAYIKYIKWPGAPAYSTTQIVASGQCGNNAEWVLSADGELTVFGSGAMYDFSFANRPWYDYCLDIKRATVCEGITRIGTSAFYGCTGLTEITIPSSVTSIVYAAFAGCTGLTEITIPSSVTRIGTSVFYGCTGLTEITIPSSVTSIDDVAFADCTGLTEITIPSSVTSIGDYAFEGCTGLTEITIPSSVTSIGEFAFSGCTGVESITVAAGNTVYHSSGNCLIETNSKTLIAGFKNSVIPTDGSVTGIGESAFYDCTGLTEITIPSSVTCIGDYAFWGCTGLTSITFWGATPPEIDEYAFSNLIATAYIPAGSASWTADKMQNYSGIITWETYATGVGGEYTLTDASATAGATVDIYVSIKDNPGIISLRNSISYDTSALELIEVTDLCLLGGWTTPSATVTSPYTLRWADSLATANNPFDGRIAKLTFRIKEDADIRNYAVDISHIEARNVDGAKVQFVGGRGIIAVIDCIIGDTDGDGEISDWDAIVLSRYLAGWSVEIGLASADIDSDGEVSDWDGVLFDRYLAGWDVTIPGLQ